MEEIHLVLKTLCAPPSPEQLKLAEYQLSELKARDRFLAELLQLLSSNDVESSVLLLASILLKQLIEERWEEEEEEEEEEDDDDEDEGERERETRRGERKERDRIKRISKPEKEMIRKNIVQILICSNEQVLFFELYSLSFSC